MLKKYLFNFTIVANARLHIYISASIFTKSNFLGMKNTVHIIMTWNLIVNERHHFVYLQQRTTIVESPRPISIRSVLGKVVEKIVNTRLLWFLKSNTLISQFQYSFRENRSPLHRQSLILTSTYFEHFKTDLAFVPYSSVWKKLTIKSGNTTYCECFSPV